MITPEDRERERALFESERTRVLELFERQPMVDTGPFLQWIGIDIPLPQRPIGYLRLMPQDFVVEEVSREGNAYTVEPGDLFIPQDSPQGSTYYADLVKIGVSTLDAKKRLAEILNIDEKNIGFAGIKDRLALTSQRISIRDIQDAAIFSSVAEDNFFLKNISQGKGAVANGDLSGNRFTITVRTQSTLPDDYEKYIAQEVTEINQVGFWNFFYSQRFGTPRLISHLLGLHLIKQDYEGTVKTFVTYRGVRELPYFQNMRTELEGLWGNWPAIKERVDKFPYHFHLERSLIDHLIEFPTDFLGALHTIPDQVRLWMYAYDCFLFNKKLSDHIREEDVPLTLPFVTSFNPKDWEPYREYLKADEVHLPSRAYRDFPFIRVESRKCNTAQSIQIHGTAVQDKLAVFSFTLPKASYATTFLMNFFMLASGLPIVPDISTAKVDAKELLGVGTLQPVLERFKTVLERREQDIRGETEE